MFMISQKIVNFVAKDFAYSKNMWSLYFQANILQLFIIFAKNIVGFHDIFLRNSLRLLFSKVFDYIFIEVC